MSGRIVGGFLVLVALIAGAVLYYLQVYAYYDRVSAEDVGSVQLTDLNGGGPVDIPFENFKAIDAGSSPLRYRACFDVPMSLAMMTETYEIYETPTPLVGPGWFDCFDAEEIGASLESGEAVAFLGVANEEYGVDSVIAVFPDGRAREWHQLNACGEAAFNGRAVPADCPVAPEGTK